MGIMILQYYVDQCSCLQFARVNKNLSLFPFFRTIKRALTMKTKILTTMKIIKLYLGFNIKINAANKQRNWQRQYCKIDIVSKFHSFNLSHILSLHIQSQKSFYSIVIFL